MTEPTLYELSAAGRDGVSLPVCDVEERALPSRLTRSAIGLPELSEAQVVRHYLRLSQRNYGVDTGLYPLGSCTMKYNPKASEIWARLDGLSLLHPLQEPESAQGALGLMFDLQEQLQEIAGFACVSLQPAAGAQGELTALLMMRAYNRRRGEERRDVILVPDSAHGTNPASVTMAGYTCVEVPSDDRGNVDLEAVETACDDRLAGIMVTNPNTLGLFEEHIEKLVQLVHGCGGLVYGDGANLNALTGIARPGDFGIDLMHFNLHKTFATPHGGGGPGSGPVGASQALAPFLPGPIVERSQGASEESPVYGLATPEHSIGRMVAFHGNFGMFVRAWAYLRRLGHEGLRNAAMHAVLNANYVRASLRDDYRMPFDRMCMHEFVCEGTPKGTSVRAFDVSKRLMDYGFHPPTNYFPLIVKEALMVEPTETEDKATLDAFVSALRRIADQARAEPGELRDAPHVTPVRRLDEVKAARDVIVTED
ncbi:MAG: aminomethyl-transferring glycine dehydrogenase subunit GcvPB [Hyphomicrobiaceae bacterium]